MAIYVNYEGLLQAADDVNAVKAKFDEEMASLKQIVSETTNNDWKGPDADLFVANTTAKLKKVNDEYVEFLNQLNACINDNHDAFKETQNRNVAMQED